MPSSMVRVYRSPTGLEAHLVRSALEQHEIPAEVRNEMLASLAGGLPISDAMVEVWIPVQFVPEAAKVLERLNRPLEEAGRLSLSGGEDTSGALSLRGEAGALSEPEGPRDCPVCGEQSPAGFGECWNCQNVFA